MLRRVFLSRLLGMIAGSALPISDAGGQNAVGQVTVTSVGRGVRLDGAGAGYTLSSGTLLPGHTYSLILDGNTLRIG